MTPTQGLLADYMSDLSHQAFCAGWMEGLEFALWEIALGQRDEYGYLLITADHRNKLRRLSEGCGGWIIHDDDRGETWLSRDDWEKRFAAGRPPFVSEVDDG